MNLLNFKLRRAPGAWLHGQWHQKCRQTCIAKLASVSKILEGWPVVVFPDTPAVQQRSDLGRALVQGLEIAGMACILFRSAWPTLTAASVDSAPQASSCPCTPCCAARLALPQSRRSRRIWLAISGKHSAAGISGLSEIPESWNGSCEANLMVNLAGLQSTAEPCKLCRGRLRSAGLLRKVLRPWALDRSVEATLECCILT